VPYNRSDSAISIGICFLLAVPLAPLFSNIPPWATGCTLVLVGAMMVSGLQSLNWNISSSVIPCFVTFIIMPYTESIAYGMIAGLLTSIVMNFFLFFKRDKEIKPTKLQRLYGLHAYFANSPFFPAWNLRLFKWLKVYLRKKRLQEYQIKVHGYVGSRFTAVVLYIRETRAYWDVARIWATLNLWGYR
jgi:hypothetical protein